MNPADSVKKFKIILISVLFVLLTVILFTQSNFLNVKNARLLSQNQDYSSQTSRLEGTVNFVGAPCNPNFATQKVPPCDGPYPNYEIIIYKNDKRTIAKKTLSDNNGNYKLELAAGRYYFIQNESGIRKQSVNSEIIITAGKTTKFDIRIDIGIR